MHTFGWQCEKRLHNELGLVFCEDSAYALELKSMSFFLQELQK